MRIDYMNKRKKELNLTNAQISELSGVPMGTLSKIMAGIIKNPKLNTLQALARVLECTIDDFYDPPINNENNKSPPEKKEKTTPAEDGLSDAQRALIQFARTVPEEKAELILRVMKSILEDD